MPKQDSYEIYKRIKDVLNTRFFVRYKILIPSEISAKMELAYFWVADNDIELSFFVGFIVSFGIEIIFDVIENGEIRDMFHLLKFAKRVKKNIKEFVNESKDTYPLIRMNDLNIFIREVFRRKYDTKQVVDYMTWLDNNHIGLFDDKIILNKQEIEASFDRYEVSQIKSRRISDVSGTV